MAKRRGFRRFFHRAKKVVSPFVEETVSILAPGVAAAAVAAVLSKRRDDVEEVVDEDAGAGVFTPQEEVPEIEEGEVQEFEDEEG